MKSDYGLTNIDVKIMDELLQENFKDKTTYSKKDILILLDKYKNIRNGANTSKHKSKKRVFGQFIEYCLMRNLANFDTLILITADKGTGKSSTAIQMARAWCKLIGINFSPKRHIAYNNTDMMRAIKELNKFEPLIADEAIRFATSEDWNKSENKELKKMLGQVRTKHLFYILCFPLKIAKLEKNYLNSYVDYWIDLFDRGIGALFIKDKNPSTDVWNIKKFEKLGSWNEFTNMTRIENKMSKHPNFWKIIKVPKLHKDVYTKYLEVRESNVYNNTEVFDSVSKDDIYNSALIMILKDIITRDGSLTYVRILKIIYRDYGINMTTQKLDIIMKNAEILLKMSKSKIE